MRNQDLPEIGEAENFYGYIIGLSLELDQGFIDEEIGGAVAHFEYNGEQSAYRVPDYALFEILMEHLLSNAYERLMSDTYGISKLYIKKENGKWDVQLP